MIDSGPEDDARRDGLERINRHRQQSAHPLRDIRDASTQNVHWYVKELFKNQTNPSENVADCEFWSDMHDVPKTCEEEQEAEAFVFLADLAVQQHLMAAFEHDKSEPQPTASSSSSVGKAAGKGVDAHVLSDIPPAAVLSDLPGCLGADGVDVPDLGLSPEGEALLADLASTREGEFVNVCMVLRVSQVLTNRLPCICASIVYFVLRVCCVSQVLTNRLLCMCGHLVR